MIAYPKKATKTPETDARPGDDWLAKYFKGESFAKGTPVTV